MSWFSNKKTQVNSAIKWLTLDSSEQLSKIKADSNNQPIAIFKHSTRCSISSMAKSRLERDWNLNEDEIKIYYLDLITYRSISNEIESLYGVKHQSPQLILVKNGNVVYHNSHSSITVNDIKNSL